MLLGLFLISFTGAVDFTPHKQNQDLQLFIQSNNATECNVTFISYSNGQSTPLAGAFTKKGTAFNYTLNSSYFEELGDTCIGVSCTDGASNVPGSICRNITPSGFDNIGTFYFIFIIIIGLIFLIGFKLENEWIMTLGSILVLILGFFVIRFGIDIFKDQMTTWAIGLVIWALGIYFLFLSIAEQLKHWG